MNFKYRHLLPQDFSPDSRVWVYQSSDRFTMSEELEIEKMLKEFVDVWMSHGVKVKGSAHLFFRHFIILMADERATGISGCSTDNSVRMIKEIEKRFEVNMLNRTVLAFIFKNEVDILPMTWLQSAFDNGFITADTLYFNNLVQTKEELESKWIVPVRESWLTSKIRISV